MAPRTAVYVIDDDDAIRDAVCTLLEVCGFAALAYATGAEFLRDASPAWAGYLLTDADMTGRACLELLNQVKARGIAMPVIVMFSDLRKRVAVARRHPDAMFLDKPFTAEDLLACLGAGNGAGK